MKQFIVISIIAIICLSITSTVNAQTRWSKAKMDSVHAQLDSLDDNATVTMGQLRQAMTYLYFKTLKDGHKEYVSMPKLFKNGVANKTSRAVDSGVTRVNQVESGIVALENKANATDQRVNNVEDVISAEDALDDDEFTDRQKEILAQIRESVAKRNQSPVADNCNKRY